MNFSPYRNNNSEGSMDTRIKSKLHLALQSAFVGNAHGGIYKPPWQCPYLVCLVTVAIFGEKDFALLYAVLKDTYTKDVHGKISDSASEGQIISAFLNKSIDI